MKRIAILTVLFTFTFATENSFSGEQLKSTFSDRTSGAIGPVFRDHSKIEWLPVPFPSNLNAGLLPSQIAPITSIQQLQEAL